MYFFIRNIVFCFVVFVKFFFSFLRKLLSMVHLKGEVIGGLPFVVLSKGWGERVGRTASEGGNDGFPQPIISRVSTRRDSGFYAGDFKLSISLCGCGW